LKAFLSRANFGVESISFPRQLRRGKYFFPAPTSALNTLLSRANFGVKALLSRANFDVDSFTFPFHFWRESFTFPCQLQC